MSNQRELAYNKIRNAITFGELKPGERLIERDICESFEVGRTPLREALRQLQMEGYVEVLPNRGAVISTISINDVEEIYSIVAVLEGFAVESATGELNKAHEQKLKSLQSSLKKHGLDKAYRKWLENNALFHAYFSEISGNNNLFPVIDWLRKKIYRYRFMAITIPGHIDEYIEAHEKILKAVFAGDQIAAGNAMREHVTHVKKVLLDYLQQYPGL